MKEERKENVRVVVYPDPGWLIRQNAAPEQLITTAKNIKDGIRRHVDDVGEIFVLWDTIGFCEHCSRIWEEDDDGCPV